MKYFNDVVLIVDERDPDADSLPLAERRDLEQTERADLEDLIEAIHALGRRAIVYKSPAELSANAGRHGTDVVWSIYGGSASRNRMALVPAICEAHGLAFVGPDVYGRIICQDKEISKRLAVECGLQTPAHRLIRDLDDVSSALTFPPPAVVKPLLEGSSIGITQRNLVRTPEELLPRAEELLRANIQPLMVETFVGGREVSYNVIESADGPLWNLCEVRIGGDGGDATFFDNALFDAGLKLRHDVGKSRHVISDEIASVDRNSCNRLLAMVDGIGYGRVDGKLLEGRFVFLEITPDAYMGKSGTFAAGFMARGMSYPQIVEAILSTGRRGPPAR